MYDILTHVGTENIDFCEFTFIHNKYFCSNNALIEVRNLQRKLIKLIVLSFLSGITFLGVPTEVYMHGSQYFAATIAALLIGLISAYVTLPVLYRLQVSSCFEYLELRFCKSARTYASVLYIISLFMYIPIVVYVPALAFSQVTGYGVHAITPVFCIVCITYTSMVNMNHFLLISVMAFKIQIKYVAWKEYRMLSFPREASKQWYGQTRYNLFSQLVAWLLF